MALIDKLVGKISTRGSGNAFRDLGIPDAERKHLRSRLFVALQEAVRESSLTQAQVAEKLGTGQPRVSLLMNGHVGEFTVDALERYLAAFGISVEPRFVRRDDGATGGPGGSKTAGTNERTVGADD
jgi:predicted XRE-type DNA-binding protein